MVKSLLFQQEYKVTLARAVTLPGAAYLVEVVPVQLWLLSSTASLLFTGRRSPCWICSS